MRRTKKRYWFRISAIVAGAFLAVLSARAAFFSFDKESTRGPSLLRRDGGVRAVGMGGAMVGISAGVASLPWNPAGLQESPRPEVQAAHAGLFGGQSLDQIGGLWPLWVRGERGTLGFSIARLAHEPFALVEGGTPAGTVAPSEMVVGMSLSGPLGLGAWGLTGKWIRQDLADQSGTAFGLDAGLLGARGPWSAGIVVVNAGTPLTIGSERMDLPLALRAGGARRFRGAGGDWVVSSQVDVPADERVETRFGAEWARALARDWTGALRGGFRTRESRFSVGAGVRQGPVEINYACVFDADLGDSHLFDLTFRFGRPLAEEARRRDLIAAAYESLDAGDPFGAAERVDALRGISPRARSLRDLSDRLNRRLAETIDPPLLWKQGQHAEAASQWAEAARAYRKLLIVQPAHEDATRALKRVEIELDRDAAEAARAAVRAERRRQGKVAAARAQRAAAAGNFSEAYVEWRRAAQDDPDRADFAADRDRTAARVYETARRAEDAGSIDRAAALYRLLSEGTPAYQDSADRGRRLSALDLESRRRRGRALYEEGLTLYRGGDRTAARRLFQRALEEDPDNHPVRRALDRLDRESPRDTRP